MSLKLYNRKRKFTQTPEPKGEVKKGSGDLKFVVQLHRATRLHYDFRLEFGGSLKSWAVPKGPSLNPLDQRLAVFVEDHPLEYGNFEGIIPKGNYGAGTVMVWDRGTYIERSSKSRVDSEIAMKKGLDRGHLTFILNGEKLKGEFALIRLKKDDKPWLLVKKRDEQSTYKRDSAFDIHSVKTGRTMEEIASQAEKKGQVWLSKRQQKSETISPIEKIKVGRPIRKIPSKKNSEPMPRKVKPMIATSSRNAPQGADWVFEKESEGLRAIAEVEGRRIHLYSKSQLPFNNKFPEIVSDLQKIENHVVLDGKIIEEKGHDVFEIFDVLYFKGRDLRNEPLSTRKKILVTAFADTKYLRKSKALITPKKGEEVLAKDINSPYKPGTTVHWLKLTYDPTQATDVIRSKPEPLLTHLDKMFWPQDKITKGDLLDYYKSISQYILPHLKDRPESLNRHPNGINSPSFYQKDLTGHLPRWIKTERIFSESSSKSIDYFVCQDQRSLLYAVNLGCIEINPWFSRIKNLDKPDFIVIDLDPDENDFSHVVEVAIAVHEILDEIGATNYCKTSGATGIHIAIPLAARYDFDSGRSFAESVCKVIAGRFPKTTSVERNPNRRKNKIYLDYMQNRRAQTLAAAYCVRPRPGAPVSMPLKWSELKAWTRPEDFNIKNAAQRLKKVGDLWAPVLKESNNLNSCVKNLKKKFGK